jgi:hypothetical protein
VRKSAPFRPVARADAGTSLLPDRAFPAKASAARTAAANYSIYRKPRIYPNNPTPTSPNASISPIKITHDLRVWK